MSQSALVTSVRAVLPARKVVVILKARMTTTFQVHAQTIVSRAKPSDSHYNPKKPLYRKIPMIAPTIDAKTGTQL